MSSTNRLFAAWLCVMLLFTAAVAQQGKQGLDEYDRAAFVHWTDPDGNGENARVDALNAAMVVKPVWVCPYTGVIVDDPARLDIDHVVPLQWAWVHGAYKWDSEKRMLFANDPINLIPVLASANRAKGSKGPDEWLPPDPAFRQEYVARFAAVCRKYGLPFK